MPFFDKDIKPKRVRYAHEIYNAEDLKQLFTVMQGDPLALLILMDSHTVCAEVSCLV